MVENFLWLVLQNGCQVEHLGGIGQDTHPGDCPVWSVTSDSKDVMNHLSRGLIKHVNLCSIGTVSEGEVDNEVLFRGSIEESENV